MGWGLVNSVRLILRLRRDIDLILPLQLTAFNRDPPKYGTLIAFK